MSNVIAFPNSSDRALAEADRSFEQAELVGEYARTVAMATMLELALGKMFPMSLANALRHGCMTGTGCVPRWKVAV